MTAERSCDTWAAMLAEARKLSDAELAKNYRISVFNRHACVECFTCACTVVSGERFAVGERKRPASFASSFDSKPRGVPASVSALVRP